MWQTLCDQAGLRLNAVCSGQGVKIYDISAKQRITNVLRDDVSLRPDMYPCSLCWKDNTTLIVGWGTSIKVCHFNLTLSSHFFVVVISPPSV